MKYPITNFALILLLLGLLFTDVFGQQNPDTTFTLEITDPEYTNGEGPVICIDSAHHNFHTASGGYAPFARVVRADGYKIRDFTKVITQKEQLEECSIYMVVNPLHESNTGGNWRLPNPSAFTEDEIEAIHDWVGNGGSFFLIADHMPFAGAAHELGRSFGFEFSNGFARFGGEQSFPDIFSKENGRLTENPVLSEDIAAVTTFTGSAFTYPEDAIPVLLFKPGDYSLEPEIAWTFTDSTNTVSLDGYSQGTIMKAGKGKLAVFGEAAMFTAQTVQTDQGPYRIGVNNPDIAPNNIAFLRNIIHWLD